MFINQTEMDTLSDSLFMLSTTLPEEFTRKDVEAAKFHTRLHVHGFKWLQSHNLLLETRREYFKKTVPSTMVVFGDNFRVPMRQWQHADWKERNRLAHAHGAYKCETCDIEIDACRKYYTINEDAIKKAVQYAKEDLDNFLIDVGID